MTNSSLKFGTPTVASRSAPARTRHAFMEPLESRQLLAIQFQTFIDNDGDVGRVEVNSTSPSLSVVDNTGTGTIFINASGTGPNGSLTITLDASDNGGTGDNRVDLRQLSSSGLRIVSAAITDIHIGAFISGNNLDVTLGDVDAPVVSLTPASQSGRRMRFAARDVVGTQVNLSGLAERARFRTLTNSGGLLANISSPAIVQLLVENNGFAPTRFSMTVPGTDSEWSVKTVQITGAAQDGTWTLGKAVQSIQVGTVFNPSTAGVPGLLAINVNGRLGTLKATAAGGDLDGTFDARSFGAITAVDRIVANIRGGASNVTFQSLDSLRADTISESFVLGGAIDQIHLGSSFSSLFDVDSIRSMNVVGGAGPAIFSSTTIVLHSTTGPNALGTFNLAGVLDNSTIQVYNNNVGSITIGGARGVSKIIVGTSSSVLVLPANLNGFANNTIKSLRINAQTGDPLNLSGLIVAARTITNLYSRAHINPSGDFGTYGITVDTISTLSFRRLDNSIFTNTGGTGFTDPGSDFELRII